MKWHKHPSSFGSRHRIGTRILEELGTSGYGSFCLLLESISEAMPLHTDEPAAVFSEKHWASVLKFKKTGLHKFLDHLQGIDAIFVNHSGNDIQIVVPVLSELAHEKAVSSKLRGPRRVPTGGYRENQSIVDKEETRPDKNRPDENKIKSKRREISGVAASSSSNDSSKNELPTEPRTMGIVSAARQVAAIYSKLRSERTGQVYEVRWNSVNMTHFSSAADLFDKYQIEYEAGCTALFNWYSEAGMETKDKPIIPYPNQLHGEKAVLIISELSGHVNETALTPADVDMQMAFLSMSNESH